MKCIKVQDQSALVDDEDYPVLRRLKWYIDFNTKQPVTHLWKDKTLAVPMTRFLKPYKVNFKLVHLDGNPLNNQKANLDYRSMAQILQSANKRIGTSSSFKGVSFSRERKGNKWLARIYKDGKKHFLGYYATQIDAAIAYNVAAQELYGDEAFINQVRS